MNFIRPKANKFTTAICSLVICSSLLSACGGSGGGSDTTAGIGGTGIAVGKITDFGSIFVNGNIFNTNLSQFIVDGDPNANQGDLSIGMVVLVKAETNNGVFTGKALEVFYDDEVEGPYCGSTGYYSKSGSMVRRKPLIIFGQTITIDETGTIFEWHDLQYHFDVNDVVEISGFRRSADCNRCDLCGWKRYAESARHDRS